MGDDPQTQQLSAELERLVVRALARTYTDLNLTFFDGRLQRPVIELSDARGRLGRWVSDVRTIEVARFGLAEHGWGAVVEVLKHEMAHQFTDEVLGVRDQSAHGPAFREVCARRGIDARAAGAPAGGGERSAGEQRVLDRIAKLLALAESGNEHEAQSAMNAAQRLMLKYNLENLATGGAASYGFLHLGEPTGRVNEAQRVLATILGDYFFVEPIWVPVWRPLEGKRGSVLEVCGTRANLDMAGYVHAFLTNTAERLWREFKKANGIRRNRDRRAYVAGVMAGFRDKLEQQRQDNVGSGLVWQGDADLLRFFKSRHPYTRTVRYGGSAGTEAHDRGREAGRKIVLHRGMEHGPSSGVRALPSRERR